jgi:hypothetical protein
MRIAIGFQVNYYLCSGISMEITGWGWLMENPGCILILSHNGCLAGKYQPILLIG